MPNGLEGEKEPTFKGVLGAVLRRIRLGGRAQQQRISQAVRTAGLRTSGVGQIPGIEAERGRRLAEAGAVTQLGQQRLGQLGGLERIRAQIPIFRELSRLRREETREAETGRTRRALIGGGAAIFSGLFGRRGT